MTSAERFQKQFEKCFRPKVDCSKKVHVRTGIEKEEKLEREELAELERLYGKE